VSAAEKSRDKLTKEQIRAKVLNLLSKEGYRKSLFRKIILMLSFLHLEAAIKQQDKMIEPQMQNILDEIDMHLKAVQFSKKEAKIIDLFKQNDAIKELQEVEINFIYFSMLLLKRLLDSSILKNFTIFSKQSKAKIKMYQVRIKVHKKQLSKKDLEKWNEIQRDTEKMAKLSWERHKYLLGLKRI